MNIFVLEDNNHFQEHLFKTLNRLKKLFLFDIENISITDNPFKILEQLPIIRDSDLVILDIEIGNERRAGLKIASKIRETHPNANLVFLTAYPDLMTESFNYRTFALDFIDKALSKNELNNRLIDDIKFVESIHCQNSKALFYFKNRYTEFKVPKDEIFYFETSSIKHKIILNSKSRTIDFTATLSEIENMDSDFIRTNKAYVANIATAIGIDKKNKLLLFSENSSCPISRNYYKNVSDLIESS